MKVYPVSSDCTTRLMTVDGIAVRWLQYGSVPSTMDVAVFHAKNGAVPWTVVSADTQTEGRGTKGSGWFSPGGKGFWVSVILPVPENLENVSDVTIAAAQALAGSLGELTGLQCALKFPNDVIVRGKKIAGILVESQTSGQRTEFMVLGMGLNLRETADDFVCAKLPDATSLFIETGTLPDDEKILECFLGHLIRRFYAAPRADTGSNGESEGGHP